MLSCVQGDPVEVLPYLYIGNSYHASQEDRLIELGITALLNVAEANRQSSACADSSCFAPDSRFAMDARLAPDSRSAKSSRGFEHMNLPIVDSATADIISKFPDAINFIGLTWRMPSICFLAFEKGAWR